MKNAKERIKSFLGRSMEMLQEPMTMKRIYGSSIAKHGGREAFAYFDLDDKFRRQSYRKANIETIRFASGLRTALSTETHGSVVVLKLSNSPLWIEFFWALLMAGFTPLLLNPKTSKAGTINLAKQAKAVAILTDDPFSYPFKKIPQDYLFMAKGQKGFKPNWANEVIFCSSGTTGDVKLMIYNGTNLCNQIASSLGMADLTDDIMYPDAFGRIRILAMIPFFHIFGFVAVFLWYTYYGKTIVFPPSNNSKDIQDLCVKEKVSHVYSVPLFWDSLALQINRRVDLATDLEKAAFNDLIKANLNGEKPNILVETGVKSHLLGNTVRMCISGGGYLKESTAKTINGVGYKLHNGFGMTEVGVTSVDLSVDIKGRLECSIGKPFHGVTYQIDGKGKGELLVKSNAIHCREIIGGAENPAELTAEGYFRTGDLVEKDAKGSFFIKGRLKDIIINADGENVFPDELELFFGGIEGIINYSVLGVKSKQDPTRESVTFVAQVRESIEKDELLALRDSVLQTGRRLPKGTVIEEVYFTNNPLPVANNMKIKRHEIKNAIEKGCKDYFPFIEELAEECSEVSSESMRLYADPLKQIFSEVLLLPVVKITNKAHWINDLGGDSMNYFELVSKINERFGITVPEEEFSRLCCINDFVYLIAKEKETNIG